MQQQLDPGRFYGRTLRKRLVGDMTLADVEYQANSHIPRHSHEYGYFCLIRRGSYVEKYSRHMRCCSPMMLVFHPPGEVHSEAFGSEPVCSFNVELGAEWLGQIRDFGGTFDQPAEFRADGTSRLALRLYQEFALNSNADSDLAIENITLEILASYLSTTVSVTTCRKPTWLQHAIEMLNTCDPPASLRALAVAVGIHPVYFAAVFRQVYGCSVGQYTRRQRMERARQLLASPDIPLSEVALRAGFADQSHLTRTYKRFTGRTPARERAFLTFKTRTESAH